MKKKLIICVVALMVLSSCQNSPLPSKENCIEVRVIDHVCGNAILQAVNPAITDLVLGDYVDASGKRIHNVFTTILPCETDESIFDDGVTFFVEIIDEQQLGSCVLCLALLSNAPEVFHSIKFTDECH